MRRFGINKVLKSIIRKTETVEDICKEIDRIAGDGNKSSVVCSSSYLHLLAGRLRMAFVCGRIKNANKKKIARKEKMVDWRAYCGSSAYRAIRRKDESNPKLRTEMAEAGYMQLTVAKFEKDFNGKYVADKIQFKPYGTLGDTILYFSNWREVDVFLSGENTVGSILRT